MNKIANLCVKLAVGGCVLGIQSAGSVRAGGPLGVNKVLMENEGAPGLDFELEDLYSLPDGFWPEGVYFDRRAGELVVSTGRSVLVDLVAVSGESGKPVWIEERLVKRLAFHDSHVEADGTVVVESLRGFMTIRATSEALVTVWINPPKDDTAAFYPMKYEVDRPGTTGPARINR